MVKKVSETYKHNILRIILGPLLKIIEACFDLMIPLIMKAIIDLTQYNEPSLIPNPISGAFASLIRSLNFGIGDALTGGIIILIMGISGYAITMVAQYIAAKTSVNVGTEIRESLYEKILSLSKKDRENIGNARLLTLINSDSYQLQQGVLLFVRLIVRAPFILLGSLVISFILDWRVGLAFTAIVPLLVLVNVLALKKSSKGYIEIQKELDSISQKTSETSEGNRFIRASNQQERENISFRERTASYENKSNKVSKINSLINPLTFAITSIVLLVIIFILKDSLLGGDVDIATTIIAEMSYLSLIFFVTVQMTQATVDIVKASVSAKRINECLAINPSIFNTSTTNVKEFEKPIIKFDTVSFSFNNDEKYFLKDISFEINEGETFAIIGGTGSGKTTIANLIERFFDVSKGNILYKGIDIKEYDLSSLRNDIGLVNQKASLFKGTIKSNYLMANSNASNEDIINSLKMAEAYEFISKYEDNIDHVINENGTNFSGGQKQRLCIGRALLKNPEILILDDSTSALDLLTDKKIRENISSLKNMTKIIISQRVSTIASADNILVIDKGQIVGLGKHDYLLDNCPIYKEIYLTQIKKG